MCIYDNGCFRGREMKNIMMWKGLFLIYAYFLDSFHVFYLMEGEQKEGKQAEWKKGGAKRISYKSELQATQ